MGRPTGNKEEEWFWAFQCWDGRLRAALQMLQLRVAQPLAIVIQGQAAHAQRKLHRDTERTGSWLVVEFRHLIRLWNMSGGNGPSKFIEVVQRWSLNLNQISFFPTRSSR